MTLYRQLLIVVTLIFSALLSVVFWVEAKAAREILSTQQQSHVDTAGTTLGLSVLPYIEAKDWVGAESVINAMFDSGHYLHIGLSPFEGPSITRNNASNVYSVPSWFTELALFTPSEHKQVITSGWMQLGELSIVGHPGYAYLQLWQSMINLAWLFGLGLVLTVLLLMLALRYLLKPLTHIRQHAEQIGQRNFTGEISEPRTLELREVVKAINTMSQRIATQFAEQVQEAEHLRQRAYIDHSSGMGNRAYFVNQMNSWLGDDGSGGILLIELKAIELLHQKGGYTLRDSFVHALGIRLNALADSDANVSVARISNLELSVLAQGHDSAQLCALAEQIAQHVYACVGSELAGQKNLLHIGISLREGEQNVSSLLAASDQALQQAKLRGKLFSLSERRESVLNRQQWQQVLEQALSANSLSYQIQAVSLMQGEVLHHEVFTRIEHQNQTYFAGQFMPLVEQLGFAPRFDKRVLAHALKGLRGDLSLSLAVNLSLSSLLDEHFMAWLTHWTIEQQDISARLAFEFNEAAFIEANASLSRLIAHLHSLGYQVGIDHYGKHVNSLGYLSSVTPHYVKIDFGFTATVLDENSDKHYFTAICRAAHNLQVHTVVQGIEALEQLKRLRELPIDAYQGYIAPLCPFEIIKE